MQGRGWRYEERSVAGSTEHWVFQGPEESALLPLRQSWQETQAGRGGTCSAPWGPALSIGPIAQGDPGAGMCLPGSCILSFQSSLAYVEP